MKVSQSCLTFCDPMGYTFHGILQARILEVCRSVLQGIFPTRDQTQVSFIVGGFFTNWATREAQKWNFFFNH